MTKMTFDNLKTRVEKRGFMLVTTPETFINTRKITVLCACGKEWTSELFAIEKPNSCCVDCAILKRAGSRRTQSGRYKNARDFFESIGMTFESNEEEFNQSLKTNTKCEVIFKCENKHVNTLDFYSFNNKRGKYKKGELDHFCATCLALGTEFRKTRIDDIETIFLKYGHKLIELEKDNKKILFVCGFCDVEKFTNYAAISRDTYTGHCVHCANTKNKKEYQLLKREVEEYGFELFTQEHEYSNNKNIHIGCTKCALDFNRSLNDVKRRLKKHYHCVSCDDGVYGKYTNMEPYCFRCYCLTHPNEEISRRYKMKENYFVDELKQWILREKIDIQPVYDKAIDNACSKRRPDVFIDLLTHVVCLELDENQHSGSTCENKRMCEILKDVGYRPLVILRLNPDKYINHQNMCIPGCFSYKDDDVTIDQEEWKYRLQYLFTTLLHYLSVENVDKNIVIEHFFYDEFDANQHVKGVFLSNNTDRHSRYVATWKEEDGKKRRKYFSVHKYGEEEAKRLAEAYVRDRQ